MKYLFFDTETCGLPLSWKAPLPRVDNWPRLVRLAWAVFDSERNPLESPSRLIKPEGFVIPYEAVRVHGVTTERALAEGRPISAVLTEFAEALAKAQIIIAHNMNFDEKVVGAEFLRLGVKHALFEKPRLCTMKSTSDFCGIPGPYGYKWPTLTELHRTLFRKGYQEAHNPAADVAACAKCFFELEKRGVLNAETMFSGIRAKG